MRKQSFFISTDHKSLEESQSSPILKFFSPRKSILNSEIEKVIKVEMSNTSNNIPEILSKPPGERKMNELLTLVQATKDIDLFKKVVEEHGVKGHLKICSIMRYEEM